MKKSIYIQKAIAFFLLVIFMISMSPKTYFHTLLARHKDVSYCSEQHTNSSCIHQQGIQCHFDDLVVSSVYFTDPVETTLSPLFYSTIIHTQRVYCQLYEFSSVKTSRGPPVAGAYQL